MTGTLQALQHWLWQFTQLFARVRRPGVVGLEIAAADAAGAVGLDQAEQAAHLVRTFLQPTVQGGWVDQRGVLGQQGASGQFIVVGQQVEPKEPQRSVDRDGQLHGLQVEVVAQAEGGRGLGQGVAQLGAQVEQGGAGAVEFGFHLQQPGICIRVVQRGVAVDAVEHGNKRAQAEDAVQLGGRQAALPQADGMVGVQGQLHIAAQATERGVVGEGHG